MTIEPVSWGVLGVANIATQKVIPAMLHSELSRVDAIASRSSDKAHTAARRFGIPRSHDSYDALIADPSIEAIYIPLPNHLHLEWTIAAARAGKHVLCEKPLALTSADAQRMIDACREAGVKLMEAFMYRLHPLWQAAVDAVSSGRVGELRAVQTVFSYFNDDPANIRNIAEMGGGALYDVGCYAVNLSRMLFQSEPTAVHAATRRDALSGTDVMTSALLEFEHGHSTFICSTQLESSQRVEILGTSGRLVIEIPFNIPPDRPTRLDHIAGGSPPVSPHVETIHIPTADPYTVQADAFSRAIRLDHDVPIPPADAVANLAVIERIFAAAAQSPD